nr:wat1-related protein [Quercus suber]
MTFSIFDKLVVLALLEPIFGMNMFVLGFVLGMKYTAATMIDSLLAMTFILVCLVRLENLNFKSKRTYAKIVGTIVIVGGAMIMTFIKGPGFELMQTKAKSNHEQQRGSVKMAVSGVQWGSSNSSSLRHFWKRIWSLPIPHKLMIDRGSDEAAARVITIAWALWHNRNGMRNGGAGSRDKGWYSGRCNTLSMALAIEKDKAAWAIHRDVKLLAVLYGGIGSTGLASYIQACILKDKGPVFVTAFALISMIMVVVLSSWLLAEKMYMGRIVGDVIIIVGIYVLIWRKGKEESTCENSGTN